MVQLSDIPVVWNIVWNATAAFIAIIIISLVLDETQFFPAWGRARLEGMMKTRPDWCVSRQRNWGVPIPFFLHKETGLPHPRTAELIEQVAQRVEKAGIEAWFSLDAAELLGAEADQYVKMKDTLDVWFDSGTTHWHVMRGYSAADVVRLRGSVQPEYTFAKNGAEKLW